MNKSMVKVILVVLGLVCAVAALAFAPVGDASATDLLSVGLGSVAVAVLI